jgi:hypothetical protein
MLTRLGPLRRHTPHRTPAIVAVLVLTAGIGAASAPVASAVSTPSQSPAVVAIPYQLLNLRYSARIAG